MQMPSRGHRYEARNKHGISIILTKKKASINVQIIWVARSPPPARCEQLGSLFRRHVLKVYFTDRQSPRLSRTASYLLFGFLPFLKSFFSPFASLKIQ